MRQLAQEPFGYTQKPCSIAAPNQTFKWCDIWCSVQQVAFLGADGLICKAPFISQTPVWPDATPLHLFCEPTPQTRQAKRGRTVRFENVPLALAIDATLSRSSLDLFRLIPAPMRWRSKRSPLNFFFSEQENLRVANSVPL